jgi:hypothetical protein
VGLFPFDTPIHTRESCQSLISPSPFFQVVARITGIGRIQMVLDLLDPQTLGRLIGVLTLMIMAAAVGYAKGHKDGQAVGFLKARNIYKAVK